MESGAGASALPVAGTGRPDEDGDEFGLFDDSVAGDARNPYPELAQARREHPVQRLDTSAMPHDRTLPVFFVIPARTSPTCCGIPRRSRRVTSSI